MEKSNTRGSKIVGRLKKFAETLEKGDPINQKHTCRTIKLDLQPQAYDVKLVKDTRQSLSASQSIFASFLGVSIKTIHDWEQGRSVPQGAA